MEYERQFVFRIGITIFSGEISEGELIQLDLLLKDKENAEEFKKLVRLHIDTNKALHTTIVDKELILNKLLSH